MDNAGRSPNDARSRPPVQRVPRDGGRGAGARCLDHSSMPTEIHPERTLWLLSIAHAVNHAQAVLLPLVYLRIIAEFGVTTESIAQLAAAGASPPGSSS